MDNRELSQAPGGKRAQRLLDGLSAACVTLAFSCNLGCPINGRLLADPGFRHAASTGTPDSTCRKQNAICSPVNLDIFVTKAPFGFGRSLHRSSRLRRIRLRVAGQTLSRRLINQAGTLSHAIYNVACPTQHSKCLTA